MTNESKFNKIMEEHKKFMAQPELVKSNQEQKLAFLALCDKYTYRPDCVTFIFTLNNTVSPRNYCLNVYPCVTVDQIDEFVDDMLRNNWYFPKKLTTARTASGMKRFMKTLF